MKIILLTTTALTMTAGIAAADVSISGDFRLGFNDTDSNDAQVGTAATPGVQVPGSAYVTGSAATGYTAATTHDNKLGVYNDAGIAIAMSSTLDNGMSAGITVDLDGNDFASQAKDRYTFSLSNDTTSVTFGSTEYSAMSNWTSAGDMKTDTWSNQNDNDRNVLKAETTVGGLKVSVSQDIAANVADGNGTATASVNPISLSIGGALGGASYVVANEGSKMGIAVATAVGGATVTTAYSTAPSVILTGPAAGGAIGDDHSSSMGTSTAVKISYPMGAVVASASYSMEAEGSCAAEVVGTATTCVANADTYDIAAVWTSGDTKVTLKTDENSANSIEGSSKLGAATIAAGLTDNLNDMYLSVTNPLGGGATIMASYAVDAGADALDEVGGPDLQEGLTVELKFAF
jgi:hypothetical protein